MTFLLKMMNEKELKIDITEFEDSYYAQISAKKFAERTGFSDVEATLIATVVSELSTNIIRYAGKGRVAFRRVMNEYTFGFELVAIDNGPGIPDVEKAMNDSFSTTKNSLGLGLSSLKRIMDEYTIESGENMGTIISAIKWKE